MHTFDIACALCTAASKHPTALAIAKEMLDGPVAVSKMSEQQTQHAKTAVDPLMTLRVFAETPETPEGKLRAWVKECYIGGRDERQEQAGRSERASRPFAKDGGPRGTGH